MIVLRHCESEFNRLFRASGRDPGIPDPPLSARGEAQAEALVPALAGEQIDRILVSPFRRALQTAAPLAAARGLRPLVEPLIRERAAFSCDEGSPPAVLAADWPELDFSGLDDVWWNTGVEQPEQVEERAEFFRRQMRADPAWRRTLIVSHWGFLIALTGSSVENGRWRRLDPTVPLAAP